MYKVNQKIGDKLPEWKRNCLTYPGRELIVSFNSHAHLFLIVFKMPKWGFLMIERFMRSFCGGVRLLTMLKVAIVLLIDRLAVTKPPQK
jgi:hypothetical protein